MRLTLHAKTKKAAFKPLFLCPKQNFYFKSLNFLLFLWRSSQKQQQFLNE